jgi:hypothetical protein
MQPSAVCVLEQLVPNAALGKLSKRSACSKYSHGPSLQQSSCFRAGHAECIGWKRGALVLHEGWPSAQLQIVLGHPV